MCARATAILAQPPLQWCCHCFDRQTTRAFPLIIRQAIIAPEEDRLQVHRRGLGGEALPKEQE
eukprot:10852745-Alexandrium_andersonii.AAC.1